MANIPIHNLSKDDMQKAYAFIYLFEKANASTFMHETAHWFKEELKKFGSEKSAMMLKKVDEWETAFIYL